MTLRDTSLERFLSALQEVMTLRRDEDAAGMMRDVYGCLKTVAPTHRGEGAQIPVCRHVDTAMREIEAAGHPLSALAGAIRAVQPQLVWLPRPGTPEGQSLADRDPGNALIVGPNGIEDRRDVRIGMSLLAPGTIYSDHSHPPPEVYLVLTLGRFRQGDAAWVSPGIGGVVFNPPGHRPRNGSRDRSPLACHLAAGRARPERRLDAAS